MSWKLIKYIETRKKGYQTKYREIAKLLEKKDIAQLSEEDQKQVLGIVAIDHLFHSEYFILNLFKDFIRQDGFDVLGNREHIIALINKIDLTDARIVTLYDLIVKELAVYVLELRNKPDYYHNKFFKNEKSIGLIRNHFAAKHNFVEIL